MSALLDQVLARWLAPEQRPAVVQFIRFILAGLLNTGVGYLIYAVGVLAGLRPDVALIGSFAFALIFNYLTHAHLVFRRSGAAIFIRFAIAYVAIYFINLLVLRALLAFGAGPLVAQAIALPFVVLCTFAIFKLVVFRDKADGPR
jgi:putative flippase GtrA